MSRRKIACVACLVGLPALTGLVVSARGQQTVVPPPPQAGTFRSQITLVPVDVRVIDRAGRPVTDLRQEDFTVLEDGVPQQIRHFSSRALVAQKPGPSGKPSLRKEPGLDLAPQDHRVFLILLGRGRLQGPSKGVDAAIRFVREKVLPQDLVAVMAYNRATDFTTDHEQIGQVLDRFKRKNDEIEGKLRHHFSGMAAMYGSREMPVTIQSVIDEVFKGPNAPESRQLPAAQVANAGRMNDDTQRTASQLLGVPGADTIGAAQVEALDTSFDDYVSTNAQSMQDASNMYTGIEYLKYIDGEKHLVFVTETGVSLPRAEDDRGLAAAANDARVVIDTIQTGGIIVPLATGGRGVPRPSFAQAFAIRSLRTIAELTGGQSSSAEYADKATDRITKTTSFSYLLGYFPTNATWDGRYRRISVRVNRVGLSVLFRHGYYGRDQVVPFDRQQFMTYSRIAAAGNYDTEMHDIKVTLTAAADGEGASRAVIAEVRIDPTSVTLKEVDGQHIGALDVTFFCGDAKERSVGELWKRIDLKLGEENFRRISQGGIIYQVKIPVKGEPRFVKVVVYDYGKDRLGSAIVKLQ